MFFEGAAKRVSTTEMKVHGHALHSLTLLQKKRSRRHAFPPQPQLGRYVELMAKHALELSLRNAKSHRQKLATELRLPRVPRPLIKGGQMSAHNVFFGLMGGTSLGENDGGAVLVGRPSHSIAHSARVPTGHA